MSRFDRRPDSLPRIKNDTQVLIGKEYEPEVGHSWNPIVSWPRNNPCFCQSGKKFKKCCMNKVSRTCMNTSYEMLRAAVKEAKGS